MEYKTTNNRHTMPAVEREQRRMEGLHDWYRTSALGRWLRVAEQRELEAVLSNLFGYHMIQIGAAYDDGLYKSCRIPHQCIVDGLFSLNADDLVQRRTGVVSVPESLPILSGSIDVVVLPHTLEFAVDPYEVVREVDRVLIPEGHVIILGFNPWSLWGGVRALRYRSDRFPWCGKFRSMSRIREWLRLVGFDTVLCRTSCFRPPLVHEPTLRRLEFMERLGGRYARNRGGVYLLLGKKRVATLTPVRPVWKPRRVVVSDLVKSPTQ
ncbi:MAG: methyltransferase domain-containing protein [Gammaproteobacteria bacterium]|nr:methyltransferase domain-containing protein [Gammaproteobacteria bacterium]